MFLGAPAFVDQETVTIEPMAAVKTHRVVAICGAPTADVSAWDSSRSGENKHLVHPQHANTFNSIHFMSFPAISNSPQLKTFHLNFVMKMRFSFITQLITDDDPNAQRTWNNERQLQQLCRQLRTQIFA